MKIVVRNSGGRNIDKLIANIPGLIVVCDGKNAWDSFIDALTLVGDEATVQMEDDAELCDGFYEQLTAIVDEFPDNVINFFSRRIDDERIGTRYIGGAAFNYNICYYLPKGMAKEIVEFSKTWDKHDIHPTGTDLVIADYLSLKGLNYLNIVPPLVQHAEGKSIIDSRRSSRRQSKMFRQDRKEFCNSKDGLLWRNIK